MQLFQPAMRRNKQTGNCRCCSSGSVMCQAKGWGCGFTSVAKEKHCPATAAEFWVLCLEPWPGQVLVSSAATAAALPRAHQPFFPRGGQTFSSPGHTQIIWGSVAVQCNNSAAKGRRGVPREQKRWHDRKKTCPTVELFQHRRLRQ